jgi:hypothetical protein
VQNSEDGTSFMPSFDDKEYKKIRVDFLKDTAIEALRFLMEEELELDKETRMALKLPEEVTKIGIGAYLITVTEKNFMITLKLI